MLQLDRELANAAACGGRVVPDIPSQSRSRVGKGPNGVSTDGVTANFIFF